MKELPCTTKLATDISKNLKKRGFKFVGPTMVYAFMQAAGFVNDHTVDCFRCALHTQLSYMALAVAGICAQHGVVDCRYQAINKMHKEFQCPVSKP